jgi:endonuclease G
MKTKSLVCMLLFLLIINKGYAQNKELEWPAQLKGKKELILKRKNYTLSFNKETNMPNWVAWRLDKKKLVERVSRKGYNFRPDPDLKPKEAVVTQD